MLQFISYFFNFVTSHMGRTLRFRGVKHAESFSKVISKCHWKLCDLYKNIMLVIYNQVLTNIQKHKFIIHAWKSLFLYLKVKVIYSFQQVKLSFLLFK